MRFFFDTEFHEDGKTIDLISIGVVSDDGRAYYAENAEYIHARATPWLKENVLPHLLCVKGDNSALKRRAEIATDLVAFCGVQPQFWAYYADYDWVVMCQLFGTMMDLPRHWPQYCRDLKQFCDMAGGLKLPAQATDEHNALADAEWVRNSFEWLRSRAEWNGYCFDV